MIRFWGVFLDETRCEFGAPIVAESKSEAWDEAKEAYPESRCIQLESPEETRAREERIFRAAEYDIDGIGDFGNDYIDDDDDDYPEVWSEDADIENADNPDFQWGEETDGHYADREESNG